MLDKLGNVIIIVPLTSDGRDLAKLAGEVETMLAIRKGSLPDAAYEALQAAGKHVAARLRTGGDSLAADLGLLPRLEVRSKN